MPNLNYKLKDVRQDVWLSSQAIYRSLGSVNVDRGYLFGDCFLDGS